MTRTLQSLALHGWFDTGSLAQAMLIGAQRRPGCSARAEWFRGLMLCFMAPLPDFRRGCRALDHADSGHVPPQITLANGATAELAAM